MKPTPVEFHWRATATRDCMLLRHLHHTQTHPFVQSVVSWVSVGLLAFALLAGFGVRIATPEADVLRRTPGLRLRLPQAPFTDAANSPIALLATIPVSAAGGLQTGGNVPDTATPSAAGSAPAMAAPDAAATGPIVVYFRDIAYTLSNPEHRASLAQALTHARKTYTLRGESAVLLPSALLYVDAAIPQARLHPLLNILRDAGLEDVLLATSPL